MEEIYRTDLSEVVMRMSELGIYDFDSFDFISPTSKKGIIGAIETLNMLDALEKDHSLSNIGKIICKMHGALFIYDITAFSYVRTDCN